MPLPGIPLWNDQDIELYHGTLDAHVSSILQGVDPTVCNHLRDFGRGFYTTTNRQKAENWANDLALRTAGGTAAVIRFTVERNELALLDCLFFIRGTPVAIDYWSFVQFCRTTATDHNRAKTGWYDIVAGPVTGSWKKQTLSLTEIRFHFTLIGRLWCWTRVTRHKRYETIENYS